MPAVTIVQPHATTFNAPRIQTGDSIGDLYLGCSLEEATDLLRSNGLISSFQDELEVFTQFGYVPQQHLQFLLGFDEALVYQNDDSPSLPVFKAYFKHNQLNFLILSSYDSQSHDYLKCKQIYTEKGIAFGDGIEDMEQRYGKNYIFHCYGDYDGEYIYLEKGVSFLFEKNQLRVIRLFNPLTNEVQIQEIKQSYKAAPLSVFESEGELVYVEKE